VLSEFNSYLEKSAAAAAAASKESDAFSKSRLNKRSLEEQLQLWRKGIGSTKMR
jgi:hypothetical protein